MMKKTIVCLLLGQLMCASVAIAQTYATLDIAQQVAKKGDRIVNKGNYQGSVYNFAMVELARCLDNPTFTLEVEDMFRDFQNGKITGTGNFQNYRIGGIGATYMDYKGMTPALSGVVRANATEMFNTQPRTSDGVMTIFGGNWTVPNDMLFIDAAFTCVPNFLYAGLKYKRQDWIDYAVHHTLRSFEVLRNSETGLLHQSRIKGVVDKAHWSRANGWGSMAIASLVNDLPADHPQRAKVEQVARDFFTAVLKYQDADGMLHQELTRHDSFVETSGTGLLLYGIGICIEKGVLPKTAIDAYKKGMSGLLDYIWMDGSINNTSAGYMSEHGGDIYNCISHNYIYNEAHAFGPVMLAFTKGYQLGINEVTAAHKRGIYADPTPSKEPRMFLRNYTQYSHTVAWENDKIAFRLYQQAVKHKCGSGIDVCTKKVPYPVWDKFYENDRRGISYHEDHGEGCDFYHAGFGRACGGTALFDAKGFSWSAEPFEELSIQKNTKEEMIVTFFYNPITVDGKSYAEEKTIRMKMGTQFMEITSVFKAVGDNHNANEMLKVGVGLSCMGVGNTYQIKDNGSLAVWELERTNPSKIGLAVVANPKYFIGYNRAGADEFVMMEVPVGQPVTYLVGAAWEGAGEITSGEAWKTLVGSQSAERY